MEPLPVAVFFVGLAVGWTIRVGYGRGSKRNVIAVERASRLEFALVALAFTAMHVLPVACLVLPRLREFDYDLPAGAGPLGGALFAVGLWLFWRSHADLGRNWSPVPRIREGQSLVTAGVYRHIRHPMYAAHWLQALAQALLLENWLAGPLVLAFFLPIYLMRVGREEQMMLDHFGDQYRQYMDRTGRAVPRLW